MKTIELDYKTDKNGYLNINYPLNKVNSNVRVLILIEDEINIDNDEEKLWMNSVLKNPSFSFLNDPEEDIYTCNDGEAIYD